METLDTWLFEYPFKLVWVYLPTLKSAELFLINVSFLSKKSTNNPFEYISILKLEFTKDKKFQLLKKDAPGVYVRDISTPEFEGLYTIEALSEDAVILNPLAEPSHHLDKTVSLADPNPEILDRTLTQTEIVDPEEKFIEFGEVPTET